MSDKEFVFL